MYLKRKASWMMSKKWEQVVRLKKKGQDFEDFVGEEKPDTVTSLNFMITSLPNLNVKRQ